MVIGCFMTRCGGGVDLLFVMRKMSVVCLIDQDELVINTNKMIWIGILFIGMECGITSDHSNINK